MSAREPIMVTGAAGQVGGIGGLVVSILLGRRVEAILGRPPRSLESMVQENRKMFSRLAAFQPWGKLR
jgi:hypothetical protein